MNNQEEDDPPRLSEETMKALLEFYEEQSAREGKLKQISDGIIPETFEEDWNLSQFWYAEETSLALARECIRRVGPEGKIACISCPTLYRKLRELKENQTNTNSS